mgnify:FL=1
MSETSGDVVLMRRDLFDVRFQIMHDEDTFADAGSDLIPGVYEGGLKTWECALDLVAVLNRIRKTLCDHDASWPIGRHLVEVRASYTNSQARLWHSYSFLLYF